MKLAQAIQTIEHGKDLSAEETCEVFDIIFKGEASFEQTGALLLGLRNKGESVSELQGAVTSMRGNMQPITSRDGAIDVVGTGGDGHGTLNVSTAAAIVTAGAGVPVAKHGNRAATSKSGSSDVLAALGVNLDPDWAILPRALEEIGLVFLFAPRHHPAMRHVIDVRRKLGVRTIFNLLGPMTNPAQVKRHVIGVYDYAWAKPMAETLKSLGSEIAWLTHGHDGLDEISTTGESLICELKSGQLREFSVTPEEFDLKRSTLDDIRGGDAQQNAQAINDLLAGQKGAYRDIVLMNAGAAIHVASHASTYGEGIKMAAKAIDSGAAKSKLDDLIRLTNGK